MQSPILSVCDSQKGPPAAEQTQLMRTSQQYNNNLNRVAMEDEKNAPKKPDNTELAFKLYDKDKDGFITKSEMSKVSKRLSKEQVDKVMPT